MNSFNRIEQDFIMTSKKKKTKKCSFSSYNRLRPSDGEYIEENLQIGDLLLIASDGLFDNLYEDLILQIINNHLVGIRLN